mmetsp:Transcript_24566/g.44333  ORF Transcript_24566/g.44333 Transcript_24566/m.44333 type:complete len:364 (-) Transcript_24566:769-1860(-)
MNDVQRGHIVEALDGDCSRCRRSFIATIVLRLLPLRIEMQGVHRPRVPFRQQDEAGWDGRLPLHPAGSIYPRRHVGGARLHGREGRRGGRLRSIRSRNQFHRKRGRQGEVGSRVVIAVNAEDAKSPRHANVGGRTSRGEGGPEGNGSIRVRAREERGSNGILRVCRVFVLGEEEHARHTLGLHCGSGRRSHVQLRQAPNEKRRQFASPRALGTARSRGSGGGQIPQPHFAIIVASQHVPRVPIAPRQIVRSRHSQIVALVHIFGGDLEWNHAWHARRGRTTRKAPRRRSTRIALLAVANHVGFGFMGAGHETSGFNQGRHCPASMGSFVVGIAIIHIAMQQQESIGIERMPHQSTRLSESYLE